MRVHVVSDVHGNAEALARAGEGADALFVLGDLLDFVDYHNHSRGILGRIFGPEKVAHFAELRRDGRRTEMVSYIRSLWGQLHDAPDAVEKAIREQYQEVFSALPVPAYATPGNVDLPSLWPEFAAEGVHIMDGQATEINGACVGFVGGGLLAPGGTLRRTGIWAPYLRTAEDFDAGLARLPEVDVLCTHIPPAVPELTYDVVARRFESGSPTVLHRIRYASPRYALFGHVHQPLTPRMRIGRTECVNVGHFQRTATPYVLDL